MRRGSRNYLFLLASANGQEKFAIASLDCSISLVWAQFSQALGANGEYKTDQTNMAY